MEYSFILLASHCSTYLLAKPSKYRSTRLFWGSRLSMTYSMTAIPSSSRTLVYPITLL
jgi:hypothetical protein